MTTTDEVIAQLAARIGQLENIERVRRTMARYCTAVDNKDVTALAPLFAVDAEISVAPWGLGARGHAAIVEFYARAFLDSGATRHYLSNEVIEPDGAGYRASCYFQNSVDAAPQSLRGWGNYQDWFVYENGEWKFRRKQVTVQVLGPFDQGWAGAAAVADVHAGMRDH